jgi:uncharacterized protein
MGITRSLVALCLTVTACAPSSRAPAPEVSTVWKPPTGVEAIAPLSIQELRALCSYDAGAPLDVREEKRLRDGGVTVIEMSYASPLGGRVPAILFVPDGTGSFAGLVLMHGSGGDRRSEAPVARSYARLGAVAITISSPSARPAHKGIPPFVFEGQDRSEQIQLIVDLRRAVDLLVSRPDVDPDRLAYRGVSYGGAMGGLFAAVENRLKGYVLEVGDGGLVNHFAGAWIEGMPEKARTAWLSSMWPIEPIHFVRYAAPAALLYQNGTQDAMVPPVDALRYQQAGSEPKTVLWYDSGHALWGRSPQSFRDQAAWLAKAVGIADYRMAFPPGVGIALAAWAFLTAGSLVLLTRDLWLAKALPIGLRLLWVFAATLLGPLSYAAYRLSGRGVEGMSPARHALATSTWSAAGAMMGLALVLGLLFGIPRLGRNLAVGLAVVVLVPACAGWSVSALSRVLDRSDVRLATPFRRPILADAVSAVAALAAGAFFLTLLLARFFGPWTGPFSFDLSYPPLWGGIVLAGVAGWLASYPVNLLMVKAAVARGRRGAEARQRAKAA